MCHLLRVSVSLSMDFYHFSQKPRGRQSIRALYTNKTMEDEMWFIKNSHGIVFNNNEKLKRYKYEMPHHRHKLKYLRQMAWPESVVRIIEPQDENDDNKTTKHNDHLQRRMTSGYVTRRNYVFLGSGSFEVNYQVLDRFSNYTRPQPYDFCVSILIH